MKKQLLLILCFPICVAANSQTWQDTMAKMEKIFSRYTPNGLGTEPSIGRNGKMIFSKAWGMADLEYVLQPWEQCKSRRINYRICD